MPLRTDTKAFVTTRQDDQCGRTSEIAVQFLNGAIQISQDADLVVVNPKDVECLIEALQIIAMEQTANG